MASKKEKVSKETVAEATQDLQNEVLTNLEEEQAPTPIGEGNPSNEEAPKEPKKEIIVNLDEKFDTLAEFVHERVNNYSPVTKFADLRSGCTIIFGREVGGVKSVLVKIVESVADNGFVYKDTVTAVAGVDYQPDSLENIFIIENPAKINFKGEGEIEKAEMKALYNAVRDINAQPDGSARIGTVLIDDDSITDKNDAGKKVVADIKKLFHDKFGIDVSVRYNKTAGKIHKSDSAGFNILADNVHPEKGAKLFVPGSHHYRNRVLFNFAVEGGEVIETVAGDAELVAMLEEIKP
jgi:hypothetical protein